MYDNINFVTKAEMVLGTDDKNTKPIHNTKIKR